MSEREAAAVKAALRAVDEALSMAVSLDYEARQHPLRLVEVTRRLFVETVIEPLREATLLRAALAEADSAAPAEPVMSVAMSDADEGQA
jgi:hypothetical protein